MQAAGTITSWDEFWDSYFEWELEPVDNTVRIRTDLAAVSEDSAYASTHDVYELWPRLCCPVLLVRASRPTAPGGGLVVSRLMPNGSPPRPATPGWLTSTPITTPY